MPHTVGTTARISGAERLPDGRLNIEVVGQQRFRILDLRHDQAYLTGTIEEFPLAETEGRPARRSAAPSPRRSISRSSCPTTCRGRIST